MKSTKGTRGFTLVELSIVMALIAIIAAMIVSFTSLTSLRTRQAERRTDFMNAVSLYRTAVTNGFAEMDEPNDGEDPRFSCTVGDGKITIGEKDFSLPEELDRVTAEANESGTLLRITVENEALSLSESFIIASHCGATFQIEGGSAE